MYGVKKTKKSIQLKKKVYNLIFVKTQTSCDEHYTTHLMFQTIFMFEFGNFAPFLFFPFYPFYSFLGVLFFI